MQRLHALSSRAALAAAFVSTIALAGCAEPQDTAPPVASMTVTLSRTRVALGSPIEITYRFTVAPDAPPLGDRAVFVHVLDADHEMMWTDDHTPEPPTSQWKPGQTIEYTRTVFVPNYPYVGPVTVVGGLYSVATNERLKLDGADRGDRSYPLAEFELLPQTENVFVIFKDGWHPTETAPTERGVEWQWTKKEATVAFRNPHADATLFIKVDNPGATTAEQELGVWNGTDLLGTIPVSATEAPVRQLTLPGARLGTADMVELRLVPDKTFVPAEQPGSTNQDTRELGVRVFNLFVQPS